MTYSPQELRLPPYVLSLAGSQGVRQAQELADRLRSAVEANAAVSVDTKDIADVDVSTLQLLLAAQKLALSLGKSFSLATPLADALHDALSRTGLVVIEDGGGGVRVAAASLPTAVRTSGEVA